MEVGEEVGDRGEDEGEEDWGGRGLVGREGGGRGRAAYRGRARR